MDESIKQKFDEWWEGLQGYAKYPEDQFTLQRPRVQVAVEAAFEQGFAEGVASMMDRLGMVLMKTGKIVPKPDTVASVAEKAKQARLAGDIARRNLGRIIQGNRSEGPIVTETAPGHIAIRCEVCNEPLTVVNEQGMFCKHLHNYIDEKGARRGDRKTDQDKRRRKRGHVPVRRQAKNA